MFIKRSLSYVPQVTNNKKPNRKQNDEELDIDIKVRGPARTSN